MGCDEDAVLDLLDEAEAEVKRLKKERKELQKYCEQWATDNTELREKLERAMYALCGANMPESNLRALSHGGLLSIIDEARAAIREGGK